MSVHRWSGWPGAVCLDCLSGSPTEDALVCPACYVPCSPEDEAHDPTMRLCPEHDLWMRAMATCPPDQALVAEWNATYGPPRGAA